MCVCWCVSVVVFGEKNESSIRRNFFSCVVFKVKKEVGSLGNIMGMLFLIF